MALQARDGTQIVNDWASPPELFLVVLLGVVLVQGQLQLDENNLCPALYFYEHCIVTLPSDALFVLKARNMINLFWKDNYAMLRDTFHNNPHL